MSVIRGFGLNGKSVYMNVAAPKEVFLNFVVDSTNGNGLGQHSLKSNGYVEQVYMYSTHAASSNGNPNWVGPTAAFPSANPLTTSSGLVIVQFKNTFNRFLGVSAGFVSPVTGSQLQIDNASAPLTVGQPYVITTVGNATAPQLKALGVPQGVTPAVGTPFVALVTNSGTAATSTTRVMAVGVSKLASMEAIGDGNVMSPYPAATYAGQILMFQCLAPAATTSVMTPTQPNDGTVVAMRVSFDGSTVSIDGI
jgi:hypothetical protein